MATSHPHQTQTRKRLFFVSRSYPPVRGGMELHNARIAQTLERHFTVTPIVNPYGKRLLLPFLALAWLRLLVQLRPGDRVLFGDLLSAGLTPLLRPVRRRIYWAAVTHGTDVVWPFRPYQRWTSTQVIPSLTHLIAVSRATARELSLRGASADRVSVVGNGTDGLPLRHQSEARKKLRDRFGIELTGRPVILSLGRLIPRKGLVWLAHNVAPLLPDDAILLIAGDGPDRPRLEQAARQPGPRSGIHVLGSVSDADRVDLYNAADVFVMPNQPIDGDMEGYGIALIEAASVGIPAVATALEGVQDAAERAPHATLVDPGDSTAFARAINRLLERDRAYTRTENTTAENKTNEWSWESVADHYARILHIDGST